MTSHSMEEIVQELQEAEDYAGQIAAARWTEPSAPRFQALSRPLSRKAQAVLNELGIDRLYTHQAQAIERIWAGSNVVIVSSTASGKTLCYTLPIVERIFERPTSRSMLVFPTKALAQDQLRKLEDFGAGSAFTAATFDGDTPPHRRRTVKREAQVVLTNPDMLHVGMLPYHQTWADLYRNLSYVVLDEIHIYRGVFGSHTANVIRRLRRICEHYGSNPQFICCSATISNPKELAERLVGTEFELIDDDGAAHGAKLFVFWNPPLSRRGDRRISSNIEAAKLLVHLVRHGVRCVVFTVARKVAELVLRYAQKSLGQTAPDLAERIMSYRGGYLPEQRREIERRLFDGELLGVTSTNALELGIDIGTLDATVLTGYPGSVASTWQQVGRAGRGRGEALAILVALDSPIDQYIMRNPGFIFDAASERAIIDPENKYILASHLLCAAYELPLGDADLKLFGGQSSEILEILAEARYVTKRTKWYWIGDGYPAGQISIRSASGEGYDIVDISSDGQLLGTVDAQSAFVMVHEGAVYLHQGESYLVKELDIDRKIAYVEPTDVNYYTDALVTRDVRIAETASTRKVESAAFCFGDVQVTEQVVGYQKRRQLSGVLMGTETLDLPASCFESTGVWICVGDAVVDKLQAAGCDLAGALHAAEHAMVALVPLFAMCDLLDVSGVSHAEHPDTGQPTWFIYDGYPGGVGIAECIYEHLPELIHAARETVQECGCDSGCPSCVHSPRCGAMNRPIDKAGAVIILQMLDYAVRRDGR